jgi:helix-turn-helix protein
MTSPHPTPSGTRGSRADEPAERATPQDDPAQPRMDPAPPGYGRGITTTDSTSVARILGNVLRVVRESRFLSLRQVTVRSRGGFKPSSIASYERAERRLTVDRLFALADLYRVPPEQIIAEVSKRLRQETDVDDDRRTG